MKTKGIIYLLAGYLWLLQKKINMFTFKWNYFIATIILFLIELWIGMYVHDKIIRPYVGDVLVVVLIYCFIKTFLNAGVHKVAVGVLLFSFCVEFLQYLKIVNVLGLQHNKIASIVIGTSFAWEDIIAYLIGFLLIIWVELKLIPTIYKKQ